LQKTELALLDDLNSLLEETEKLTGGIKIVERIPRNCNGKIMRHLMKNN
jgi:hypothetical protein